MAYAPNPLYAAPLRSQFAAKCVFDVLGFFAVFARDLFFLLILLIRKSHSRASHSRLHYRFTTSQESAMRTHRFLDKDVRGEKNGVLPVCIIYVCKFNAFFFHLSPFPPPSGHGQGVREYIYFVLGPNPHF